MKQHPSISKKFILSVFVIIMLVNGTNDFIKGLKKGWDSVRSSHEYLNKK